MQASENDGVIEPQLLYNYDAFTRRLGVTRKTIRAAVRNGLRVSERHRKRYILGQDWIDYVTSGNVDRNGTEMGGADA